MGVGVNIIIWSFKSFYNFLNELNNIFHVKVLNIFTFCIKLIYDRRKALQEKYWVTWFDTKSNILRLWHGNVSVLAWNLAYIQFMNSISWTIIKDLPDFFLLMKKKISPSPIKFRFKNFVFPYVRYLVNFQRRNETLNANQRRVQRRVRRSKFPWWRNIEGTYVPYEIINSMSSLWKKDLSRQW